MAAAKTLPQKAAGTRLWSYLLLPPSGSLKAQQSLGLQGGSSESRVTEQADATWAPGRWAHYTSPGVPH